MVISVRRRWNIFHPRQGERGVLFCATFSFQDLWHFATRQRFPFTYYLQGRSPSSCHFHCRFCGRSQLFARHNMHAIGALFLCVRLDNRQGLAFVCVKKRELYILYSWGLVFFSLLPSAYFFHFWDGNDSAGGPSTPHQGSVWFRHHCRAGLRISPRMSSPLAAADKANQ